MSISRVHYTYGSHDSIRELQNPPAVFWPIYSWGWRGTVTPEGIAERLDSMLSRGIRRVYILPYDKNKLFTKKGVDYLSESYAELIRCVLAETEKRGMEMWMYDEVGCPSGSANGLVLKNRPDLIAMSIDSNGKSHSVPPLSHSAPYPDLIHPDTAPAFLTITHEWYKNTVGGNYGNYFPVTFTDEPHVRGIDGETLAWTADFDEEFRKRFGYNIREHLDALFDLSLQDNASFQARADYRDLLSQLFTERYFLPIRAWCEKNGSLSTGHMGGDDVAVGNGKWGYYHILRCLRSLHIPGVDTIWRQIFPGKPTEGPEPYAPLCSNLFFPRYASSAAHQIGSALALTESFAIYGSLTYDQMRWIYNFQAVCGLNVLNPMNMSYTYEDTFALRLGQPNYAPNLPGAEDLLEFNRWAARVSYLLSAGKPCADSALYLPLTDIWQTDDRAVRIASEFEQLGAELEKRGCDFDIIDDDAILEAECRNGVLSIGNAAYSTLYFQPDITLPDKLKERLKNFEESGGKVVTCTGEFPVTPRIKSDTDCLRALKRVTEEGSLYYITNESYNPVSGTTAFPAETAETALEISLITGENKRVSVCPYTYSLASGEEAVLLFDGKESPASAEIKSVGDILLCLEQWTCKILRSVQVTVNGIEECFPNEVPISVSPGDWCEYFGKNFSGDCLYTAVFTADKSMTSGVLLDLGDVACSCEVTLNDDNLGKCIFSPFFYRIYPRVGENRLTVRVSNTIANAQLDAYDRELIPNFKPTVNQQIAYRFQRESLKSGLIGPVFLRSIL